ncbi:FKBP-type peptidyl-prolyl cis-trans isomerase [Nocardiopsis alba]|uniref:FKBP-type peptidyl-prolyl cis-trans isomerase n=1 Tax=Nocardiopsis alba TaxID=53437 RepID=UPI0033B15233
MALERPEIDFIDGPPPAELKIRDIKVGEGDQAGHGSKVSVQYVGVAFSTGEEFDASWNRGEPLNFQLGAKQVIPGWEQGVMGMRVGGRRELIIPPHLAYGDRGAGGVIKGGETLVFVVDLVGVA